MMERIYGRVGYLGRKGELRECQRSNRRVRERVSARHGRYGVTRAQRRDVLMKRTPREVHGKDTIWVVGQEV